MEVMFEQRPEEVREGARWTWDKLPTPPHSACSCAAEKVCGAFEEEPGGGEWQGDQGEDEELRPEQAGGQASISRKSLLSTLHKFALVILSHQNIQREARLLSFVSRGN